jgi:pimeloyl-ACP methyl ester carboxylesterase
MHTFAEMFKQAQAHDAADLLPRVAVPTLIVTGGRDRLAPAEWSREMNRMIPGSEIMLIPDATHYCPIEHPEIFNLRVEKFLRDHEVA